MSINKIGVLIDLFLKTKCVCDSDLYVTQLFTWYQELYSSVDECPPSPTICSFSPVEEVLIEILDSGVAGFCSKSLKVILSDNRLLVSKTRGEKELASLLQQNAILEELIQYYVDNPQPTFLRQYAVECMASNILTSAIKGRMTNWESCRRYLAKVGIMEDYWEDTVATADALVDIIYKHYESVTPA